MPYKSAKTILLTAETKFWGKKKREGEISLEQAVTIFQKISDPLPAKRAISIQISWILAETVFCHQDASSFYLCRISN